jgi:hypothetical protein
MDQIFLAFTGAVGLDFFLMVGVVVILACFFGALIDNYL